MLTIPLDCSNPLGGFRSGLGLLLGAASDAVLDGDVLVVHPAARVAMEAASDVRGIENEHHRLCMEKELASEPSTHQSTHLVVHRRCRVHRQDEVGKAWLAQEERVEQARHVDDDNFAAH